MLTGYRVLDLTDVKGMFCGKLFADLGAECIKVEPPGGDAVRRLGPFYHDEPDPEKSLLWFALNTGKRGITLDVGCPEGRGLLLRLAEKADFVLESFAPGYLENLGLGYSSLSASNPGLILTSITPFGQDGPCCNDKATDFTLMARGGLHYVCGDPDRPPVTISAEPQAYFHGSCAAAVASFGALWQRHATGEGQHVDVSIFESLLHTPMFTLPHWEGSGHSWRRLGNRQQRTNVTYRLIFPCKDGFVSGRMGFGRTYGAWGRRLSAAMMAEGLGTEELRDVPWETLTFEGNPQERIDRWEELMIAFFGRHTKKELQELGLEREIALSPINTIPELVEYDQLIARQYWVELEHPDLDAKLTYPGPFFRAEGVETAARGPAPHIGQHNDEVFGELGLSTETLAELRERRVI